MEKITVETSTIQETHQQNSPTIYNNHRNRCCFTFPCFGPGPKPHYTLGNGPSSSSSSSSLWDRFREGENENKWWATPIKAIKKIREWSEIVAGPKWKTFIRRFNRKQRNNHHHHNVSATTGMFQYDPLSYALNFDDKGQNGHFDEEGFSENFPDFSSRFAASGSSARQSVDFGRNSS